MKLPRLLLFPIFLDLTFDEKSKRRIALFKRFCIIFVLCLSVQQVQSASVGQKVQVGAKLFETLAGLWTDTVDTSDQEAAKKVAVVRALARIAGGLEKGLYAHGIRDNTSKALHANAIAWGCAKDIAEFRALDEIEEVCEEAVSEGMSKKMIRPVLRIADFILSASLIFSKGRSVRTDCLVISQAFLHLLMRYMLDGGTDVSENGVIRIGEAVSSALPECYDCYAVRKRIFDERRRRVEQEMKYRKSLRKNFEVVVPNTDEGDDDKCVVCLSEVSECLDKEQMLFPCCKTKMCKPCSLNFYKSYPKKKVKGVDTLKCPGCRMAVNVPNLDEFKLDDDDAARSACWVLTNHEVRMFKPDLTNRNKYDEVVPLTPKQ